MKHNGPYRKDFSESKFGRLLLIRYSGYTKNGSQVYFCICDCKTEITARHSDMKRGQTLSCGCLQKEIVTKICVDRSLPKGRAALNNLYRHYKSRAKKKKLPWELEIDYFKKLTGSKCNYCGSYPKQLIWPSGTKTTGPIKYNGINRVDSNLGYTIKNSVPCCKYCNVAKLDLTENQFYSLIEKIYNYKIKGNNLLGMDSKCPT